MIYNVHYNRYSPVLHQDLLSITGPIEKNPRVSAKVCEYLANALQSGAQPGKMMIQNRHEACKSIVQWSEMCYDNTSLQLLNALLSPITTSTAAMGRGLLCITGL